MNQLPTAVFLDRDGTIIEDRHYLSRPEEVTLLPGAGDAIARINALLIPVIVVTNQSGIARGILTVEDHNRVTERLDELLREHGAHLDATYFCPHAPEDACDCRKPGTLLFRQAAHDHPEINLTRALYIGDKLRDLEPGLTLGGQAVLVPSAETPQSEIAAAHTPALDWYMCTN